MRHLNGPNAKIPANARLRLQELADGTHAVIADLPGQMEITVADEVVIGEIELTAEEHDQLAAGMANGQSIAKQAQAIVKQKHNGNLDG